MSWYLLFVILPARRLLLWRRRPVTLFFFSKFSFFNPDSSFLLIFILPPLLLPSFLLLYRVECLCSKSPLGLQPSLCAVVVAQRTTGPDKSEPAAKLRQSTPRKQSWKTCCCRVAHILSCRLYTWMVCCRCRVVLYPSVCVCFKTSRVQQHALSLSRLSSSQVCFSHSWTCWRRRRRRAPFLSFDHARPRKRNKRNNNTHTECVSERDRSLCVCVCAILEDYYTDQKRVCVRVPTTTKLNKNTNRNAWNLV